LIIIAGSSSNGLGASAVKVKVSSVFSTAQLRHVGSTLTSPPVAFVRAGRRRFPAPVVARSAAFQKAKTTPGWP
jgi:hypothetical protein